jgi:hypothetical protein
MGKNEYKEYATARAKALYGTDAIEVDNDGNVTVGTGDSAKTVSRAEFEKQLAASQSTENAAKALENLPRAIDKVAGKMGAAGKALEKTYAADEGKALTKEDLSQLKQYDRHELGEMYYSLSEEE